MKGAEPYLHLHLSIWQMLLYKWGTIHVSLGKIARPSPGLLMFSLNLPLGFKKLEHPPLNILMDLLMCVTAVYINKTLIQRQNRTQYVKVHLYEQWHKSKFWCYVFM